MITRKAHYQHETKVVQKNTNMFVLQINCFVIYLNHITFSIAVRWYAKLHPNPKPFKANENVRNVSVHVTSLTFGTNDMVSKLRWPCQQYLFPLSAFFRLWGS